MKTDDQLDGYFRALRAKLIHATGQNAAMSIDQLTRDAGIPDRRTCEVILETRLEDFGFVLVSGSKGYYRPTTAESVNRYLASLESRIKCLSVRHTRVSHMAKLAGFIHEGNQFVARAAQGILALEIPETNGKKEFHS